MTHPMEPIMRTSLPRALAAITISLVLVSVSMAQGKLVDRRDQAEGWYLPVQGKVLVNGKQTSDCSITLDRDNENVGEMKCGKKGDFVMELDIDKMYTIRVMKDGFQEKILYVDTKLPENLVEYPDFELTLNLNPYDAAQVDPFYTDFPSALIRYDEEMKGFYHSEHYLSHIQTKLAGVMSATF